jgi:hypothetical protein
VTSGDAPLPIDRAGGRRFGALERRGYTLVGPTVRDWAIVLEVHSTAELPAGWADVRDAVDEVSRELLARLGKPAAGRRAGPDAGRAPSP